MRWTNKSRLDDHITSVLLEMQALGPEDEDYPKQLENLERLIELQTKESKSSVSPDTIVMVLGNLIGILIIVAYEQKHVMSSKSLNFIPKTRPMQ